MSPNFTEEYTAYYAIQCTLSTTFHGSFPRSSIRNESWDELGIQMQPETLGIQSLKSHSYKHVVILNRKCGLGLPRSILMASFQYEEPAFKVLRLPKAKVFVARNCKRKGGGNGGTRGDSAAVTRVSSEASPLSRRVLGKDDDFDDFLTGSVSMVQLPKVKYQLSNKRGSDTCVSTHAQNLESPSRHSISVRSLRCEAPETMDESNGRCISTASEANLGTYKPSNAERWLLCVPRMSERNRAHARNLSERRSLRYENANRDDSRQVKYNRRDPQQSRKRRASLNSRTALRSPISPSSEVKYTRATQKLKRNMADPAFNKSSHKNYSRSRNHRMGFRRRHRVNSSTRGYTGHKPRTSRFHNLWNALVASRA